LGSCASNTVAGCIRFCVNKSHKTFYPSRLFIYYNGRSLPGYDINTDSGLFLRDAYKSVSQNKVCTEQHWEYDTSKFTIKPLPKCYQEASKLNKSFTYYNINQDLNSIKSCISDGFPISFGLILYSSFLSQKSISTGQIDMPNIYTEDQIGGHAITIVGYDDNKKLFTVANSWGSKWGDAGYCYIPYSYILDSDFASDFWTVRGFDVDLSEAEGDIKSKVEKDHLKSAIADTLRDVLSDVIKEVFTDIIQDMFNKIINK